MQPVRPAAVAGLFYPGEPDTLRSLVDNLLADAPSPRDARVPKALIVPHAGYVFSGSVAAAAYATLQKGADRIRRVVLIGPTHRVFVRGIASPGASAMATPLGEMRVDVDALDAAGIPENPLAHAREHSLEVELPFLQRVLPHASVIPLAVGNARIEEVGRVLEALWGGPETVIVVSSDLSHYLSYADGRALDRATAARIEALDPEVLPSDMACGATGINGLLWVARRKHLEPVLLDLRSSGDTAGGRNEVVGYGAFALYEEDRGAR
jgi:AmmeMemoRadiSam system protein B